MKKVLFATTALIASATMAAAEVKITGYARFGLDYNDANERTGTAAGGRAANGVSSTNITSRMRLNFDASTVTDGGVTLGARFRVQASSGNNRPAGAGFNAPRFYATYGGFTLGVGNIIGALEATPNLYTATSAGGFGIDGMSFHNVVTNVAGNVAGQFFNWDSYDSTGVGANGLEVIYSAGAFKAHLSYSTDNGPRAVDRIAAHVAYTFGDWTVALATQDSDIIGEDKTVLTIGGKVGNFSVAAAFADNDGIQKAGLYGYMDIGTASTIGLFVTQEDAADAGAIAQGRDNRDNVGARVGAASDTGGEGTSIGINYVYDLGGGAEFTFGAVKASTDNTRVQAGVFFSF
ncbi:MAG: porin [Pseudooceanicola sp.]|nr:porin [Pseudooceanicola sp.]